ncbi:MAG: hypothetical protein OIF50_10390 [Flavobacteriaceae bacterium]|nr:hypothetical protein [Flavobacteriaceae bacterium]
MKIEHKVPIGFPFHPKLPLSTSETDLSAVQKRVYGEETTYIGQSYREKVQYKIEVAYLHQNAAEQNWKVILRKKDCYINNKRPLAPLDRLNISFVEEVLYPIQLLVHNNGHAIKICDLETLQERLQKFERASKKRFKGVIIDHFFEQLRTSLSSEKGLLARMKKDWFWSYYFMPIYQPYGVSESRKFHFSYPAKNAFDQCNRHEGIANLQTNIVLGHYIQVESEANWEIESEKSKITSTHLYDKDDFRIAEIHATANFWTEAELTKSVETKIMHLTKYDAALSKSPSFWEHLFGPSSE